MWNILVLVVMVSLTGLYSTIDKEGLAAKEEAKALNLADSMALYREAVITYFTRNPTIYTSVDIGTLKSTHALPAWSTLYIEPATSIWANYRDDNGVIYIYASSLPPVNIVAEIVKLSHNSYFAGVFRTGDITLYSPAIGDTKIPLPSPALVPIPNGSPVWIAMRR